ncbi:MAG TPA: CHRD domain-containing protein [Gemmatimonadaceae bacterium]|nr:CHRD domain-containing protein [Gemmatimonadaceae bacterium]
MIFARKSAMFAAAVIVVGVTAIACSDDPVAPVLPVFSANLNGANEVPPRTTPAAGIATFTDNGATIDYTLDVSNLTGVTAGHIHVGASGVNGPIIVFLFSAGGPGNNIPRTVTGTLSTGIINENSSSTVTLDSLRTLFRNGNSYVNVHTTTNPGGEIRAQVLPSNN